MRRCEVGACSRPYSAIAFESSIGSRSRHSRRRGGRREALACLPGDPADRPTPARPLGGRTARRRGPRRRTSRRRSTDRLRPRSRLARLRSSSQRTFARRHERRAFNDRDDAGCGSGNESQFQTARGLHRVRLAQARRSSRSGIPSISCRSDRASRRAGRPSGDDLWRRNDPRERTLPSIRRAGDGQQASGAATW
jgi:hypothetical protein